MRRRAQANPMRFLIMLAVMWAAGSWLFAAETSPVARAKQPAQTQAQAVAAQEVPAQAPVAEETSDASDDESAAKQGEQTIAQDDTSAKSDDNEGAADNKESEESKEGEGKSAATAKRESAADAGASPRRFVPSEQVRADFDVSFPIDI